MLKRGRVDGHLTKEEYYEKEDNSSERAGEFSKASPNTMASRRIVSALHLGKKEQFAKHIQALNQSFHDWFHEQMKSDSSADYSDGFQDYLDHLGQLEDRYLRTYGEVLTFGSGDCGQLAHGIDNDEDLMVKYPRIVYSLRDKKVCGIACGGIHNAIYTETGQVYTWGCADDGSLGRTGEEYVPELVSSLTSETIIRVACGDGQTIAVSTSGDVFGWGCYKDKEGKKWFNPAIDAANPMKDIKKQQNTALKIGGLSDVVEVACGSSFNLALTSSGVVYSWGIGECGELGRHTPPLKKGVGEEVDYDLPSILAHHITPARMYLGEAGYRSVAITHSTPNTDRVRTAVDEVKSIGCGAYHSMVVLSGGSVYACGLNNYGQLGLGNSNDTEPRYYLVPVPLLDGKGITALCGGMHHTLVLSSSGQTYTFGRGDSGQLGSSQASTKNAGDFSSAPVEPSLPAGTKVTSIACGGNHNLVLTDKSEIYSWGYGDMLALGHGLEQDELLPKKINFSKAKIRNIAVTQVSGGGQHSAIIGQVTMI